LRLIAGEKKSWKTTKKAEIWHSILEGSCNGKIDLKNESRGRRKKSRGDKSGFGEPTTIQEP